jgi:hypothetical protein
MDVAWDVLLQVSTVIVGLAAGQLFTVPLVRRLKALLGTTGQQTNVLVWVVALVLTLASAVVEGVLAPGTIDASTWGLVVLSIVKQAETRYRQLKDDLQEA